MSDAERLIAVYGVLGELSAALAGRKTITRAEWLIVWEMLDRIKQFVGRLEDQAARWN